MDQTPIELTMRVDGMTCEGCAEAVRRTVEGMVPFRSWVRKLTGAEKHSKEVAASIIAGGVRR